MYETVREVGRFASEHAPDDVFHRGGTIDLARNEPQRRRLLAHLAEQRRFGFDDDDHRWMGAAEATATVRADRVIGAVTTPHCATVHPLRLVHALARAVADAGVTIAEGVEVTGIHPRRLETSAGRVLADVVVRATEGYTCDLPGERRSMLPIYSLMIATEPLPAEVWDEIGLDDRPTFTDARNLIVYGQRTADGRFAFGGRGAAYRYGSRISADLDHDERVRDLLVDELVGMFPAVRGAAITNHWGGVLGATRDWQCAVQFDRRTGFATAGGYVGDGVATTNLAGRTLAALIGGPSVDGDEALLRLPWVGHRSRRWEPEPLRWIGVNAARVAARRADRFEARHDDTSRLWSGVMSTLLRR
jgi:glycine/D-amino acid oxidase-like deaminating enzyme